MKALALGLGSRIHVNTMAKSHERLQRDSTLRSALMYKLSNSVRHELLYSEDLIVLFYIAFF